MNPFKYRPYHLEHDPELPEAPDDIDWEDNWLSNSMAWVSQTKPFEPMCNEKHYLSSRIANYFFTDCPCCLFYRGLFVGGTIGLGIGIVGALLWP